MLQVRHTDPKVTLGLYAKVMFRKDGEKEKVQKLVEGLDWARMALRWSYATRPTPSGAPRSGSPTGIRTMGTAGFEPATSRV
jgi:hypothetical protein